MIMTSATEHGASLLLAVTGDASAKAVVAYVTGTCGYGSGS